MDALSLPELTPWLISIGVAAGKAAAKIALIFALGLAGMRFLGPALKQLESLVARTGRLADVDSDSSRKRTATLTGILRTVVVSLIWGGGHH